MNYCKTQLYAYDKRTQQVGHLSCDSLWTKWLIETITGRFSDLKKKKKKIITFSPTELNSSFFDLRNSDWISLYFVSSVSLRLTNTLKHKDSLSPPSIATSRCWLSFPCHPPWKLFPHLVKECVHDFLLKGLCGWSVMSPLCPLLFYCTSSNKRKLTRSFDYILHFSASNIFKFSNKDF